MQLEKLKTVQVIVDKAETGATASNIVVVPYSTGENGIWWNETCAMVLEVFGLPGNRYTTQMNPDLIAFNFTSPKDAAMCKILLSDRLLTL